MLNTELKRTTLHREIGTILDIAPIDQAAYSEWLVLAENRCPIRLNAESLSWKQVSSSVLLLEPDHALQNNKPRRHHLRVSARSRFGAVAVVNDDG
jgi:hypothetical protein